MLTINELERLAYASGDLATVGLVARCEEELLEVTISEDEADDLRREVEKAEEMAREADEAADDARDEARMAKAGEEQMREGLRAIANALASPRRATIAQLKQLAECIRDFADDPERVDTLLMLEQCLGECFGEVEVVRG